MKISELIKSLENIKELSGDAIVRINTGYFGFDLIDKIETAGNYVWLYSAELDNFLALRAAYQRGRE